MPSSSVGSLSDDARVGDLESSAAGVVASVVGDRVTPPDWLEAGVEEGGEEEDTAERDGSSEGGGEDVVVWEKRTA